jgi:uncharacterized membrane protein
MTKLRIYWDAIRSSLWFVPSLMATAAVAAAFVLVTLDRTLGSFDYAWLYTGGAEGAREVLGTIAASMVGVAGVAFSITIVALSLASQQLGPRLLRSYMRDRGNQVVLGTFVATFLYCILVLRTVRGTEDADFVPEVSVTAGVVLAVCSLGVLIYFIHHMSMLIQAPTVIASVGAELDTTIDRLFPERIGDEDGEQAAAARPAPSRPSGERDAERVRAAATGVLESIDPDKLIEVACGADLVVELTRRPGDFIIEGGELMRVWPRGRIDDELRRQLRNTVTLAARRTPTQDVEFAVQQLVEIALRALSPASNDPFTAMGCVERLGAALVRLGRRRMPSPLRVDSEGRLRVIATPVSQDEVVQIAFDQIRQNARGSQAVTIRMLEVIAEIGACGVGGEMSRALLRQVEMIERASRAADLDPRDRQDLAHHAAAARGAFAGTEEPRADEDGLQAATPA